MRHLLTVLIFTTTVAAQVPGPCAAGGFLTSALPDDTLLTVNGTNGGALRRVTVAPGQPITVAMGKPWSNPTAENFAIFGFIGTPTAADVTVLPAGIGTMCFPPCAMTPTDPRLFTLTNNYPGLGICAQITGSTSPPWHVTATAPAVPFTFTLQGVMQNTSSGVPQVTNAIVVDIAPGGLAANNPSPPDLHLLVDGHRLVPVSGASSTHDARPVAFGGVAVGTLALPPVAFDDPSTLGTILDVEFGRFINTLWPYNQIHNPPRRLAGAMAADMGEPVPPHQVPESSLGPSIGLFPNAVDARPVPPLGSYLYVIDGPGGHIDVIDSTTFTLLDTITTVADPRGLGISPDLAFLYVSSFSQDTVTRLGTIPQQALTFHQAINTVPVGPAPIGISVHPGNEDVFVVNSGANSMSIIDVPTQTVRAAFATGNGAREVIVTERMLCLGCPYTYMAFVPNFFDDTVSVYESDTPLPTVMNGPNGIMLPPLTGFSGPRAGAWNRRSLPGPAPNTLGAFIVNTNGNTVDEIALTSYTIFPIPPFPPVPPPALTWSTVQTFAAPTGAGSPADATVESMSALSVVPGNHKGLASVNSGSVPSILIVSYPASGQLVSYDVQTGTAFGAVAAAGTALYSYYDQ